MYIYDAFIIIINVIIIVISFLYVLFTFLYSLGAVHYSHPDLERDYVMSIYSDLSYISALTHTLHPMMNMTMDINNHSDNIHGVGSALLLVICEFLHDIMESRAFHSKLVKEIDKGGMDFQADFLEFSEQCLQLLSKAASCIEEYHNNDRDDHYNVTMGQFSFTTSLSVIAKSTRYWSLSLLQSLQRLLDTPTFVAILQVYIYTYTYTYIHCYICSQNNIM